MLFKFTNLPAHFVKFSLQPGDIVGGFWLLADVAPGNGASEHDFSIALQFVLKIGSSAEFMGKRALAGRGLLVDFFEGWQGK
jgi:hypothetical protein